MRSLVQGTEASRVELASSGTTAVL